MYVVNNNNNNNNNNIRLYLGSTALQNIVTDKCNPVQNSFHFPDYTHILLLEQYFHAGILLTVYLQCDVYTFTKVKDHNSSSISEDVTKYYMYKVSSNVILNRKENLKP